MSLYTFSVFKSLEDFTFRSYQDYSLNFAETCTKILQDNADFLVMINTTKHFKAESQQKYRAKHYRIQTKEDVMHKDLKMG